MSSMAFIVDICIPANEVHVLMTDFTYDGPLAYADTFDCTNMSTDIFSCARSYLFKYSSDGGKSG
jgi:hypothetical protein